MSLFCLVLLAGGCGEGSAGSGGSEPNSMTDGSDDSSGGEGGALDLGAGGFHPGDGRCSCSVL